MILPVTRLDSDKVTMDSSFHHLSGSEANMDKIAGNFTLGTRA